MNERASVALDLAQRAPVGLALTDADWVLLAANETLAQWTGVPKEELVGRRLAEFLSVPSKYYLETHVRPLLRMQEAVREVALEMVGPPPQHVLLNADQFTDGQVSLALLGMHDRRSYEEELRRARRNAEAAAARHALVAEAAPKLVGAETEAAAAEAAATLAAARLCDVCTIHVMRDNQLELASQVPGPVSQDVADLVQAAMDTAEPVVVDPAKGLMLAGAKVTAYAIYPLQGREATGAISFFWQSVAAEPQRELLEEYACLVSLAVAGARSHEQARRAVAAREAFIGVLGHEFANPLTALQMQVTLWRRRHEDGVPADLQRFLTVAERNLDRMGRIVQDMLDVSRLRSGRFRLAREPIDLAILARDVLLRMQPTLHSHGVEGVVAGDSEAPCRADPVRMEQVLTNLLINAAKYGKGPVEVHVGRDAGHLRLHVRDHGSGIPEPLRDKVFARFERLGRDGKTPGTGLGLYIVRQLVEAHDGRVWVEDTPGGGATFVVELPT